MIETAHFVSEIRTLAIREEAGHEAHFVTEIKIEQLNMNPFQTNTFMKERYFSSVNVSKHPGKI